MNKLDLPKAKIGAKTGVRSNISDRVIQRWNPDVRAASGQDNAISVLDPIGDDYFGEGVTAKRIGAALRSIGDGDVVVNINSPGGDYFEGLAIYNVLREHPGKVTCRVLGLAASAASVIAMAGDEIQVARAGFLMIHNTWVLAAGDRHAFREVADWLEPFDMAAVDIYTARSGLSDAQIVQMLDRETWIGGQACVDQGFADSLLPSDEVENDVQNGLSTSVSAQKKLDLALATGKKMSRSQRRELYAALKQGMPRAASDGMPRAAIDAMAKDALAKLSTF